MASKSPRKQSAEFPRLARNVDTGSWPTQASSSPAARAKGKAGLQALLAGQTATRGSHRGGSVQEQPERWDGLF